MPHTPRFTLTSKERNTLSAALSLLAAQLEARADHLRSSPPKRSPHLTQAKLLAVRQTLSDTLALHAKLLAPTLPTPTSDVPTSSLPVSEDLSNEYRTAPPADPRSVHPTVVNPPPAKRELDNLIDPSRDKEPKAESPSHRNTDFDYVAALTAMMRLSDEERLSLFANFCKSCGCEDPSCQCWNDE